MKRFIIALFLPLVACFLFAALPATDNFTRADADPAGGNWTGEQYNIQIYTNLAYGSPTGNFCIARWNADVSPDDQYSQVTTSGSGVCGAAARIATGASTFYATYLQCTGVSATQYLVRWNAGSQTIVDTQTFTVPIPDGVVRLEVSGSNPVLIVAKVGGTQQLSYSDSSASRLTSGSIGVALGSAGVKGWEGGALSAARRRQPVVQ